MCVVDLHNPVLPHPTQDPIQAGGDVLPAAVPAEDSGGGGEEFIFGDGARILEQVGQGVAEARRQGGGGALANAVGGHADGGVHADGHVEEVVLEDHVGLAMAPRMLSLIRVPTRPMSHASRSRRWTTSMYRSFLAGEGTDAFDHVPAGAGVGGSVQRGSGGTVATLYGLTHVGCVAVDLGEGDLGSLEVVHGPGETAGDWSVDGGLDGLLEALCSRARLRYGAVPQMRCSRHPRPTSTCSRSRSRSRAAGESGTCTRRTRCRWRIRRGGRGDARRCRCGTRRRRPGFDGVAHGADGVDDGVLEGAVGAEAAGAEVEGEGFMPRSA